MLVDELNHYIHVLVLAKHKRHFLLLLHLLHRPHEQIQNSTGGFDDLIRIDCDRIDRKLALRERFLHGFFLVVRHAAKLERREHALLVALLGVAIKERRFGRTGVELIEELAARSLRIERSVYERNDDCEEIDALLLDERGVQLDLDGGVQGSEQAARQGVGVGRRDEELPDAQLENGGGRHFDHLAVCAGAEVVQEGVFEIRMGGGRGGVRVRVGVAGVIDGRIDDEGCEAGIPTKEMGDLLGSFEL